MSDCAKILLVSATELEVTPVRELVSARKDVELLVTGVGQMMAAYALATRLGQPHQFSLALNVGIAGSFRDQYPKGTLVSVREEILADLGAEDHDETLDLFQMKLLRPDDPPFTEGVLRVPPNPKTNNLPSVRSLTVNRALGSKRSVDLMVERYNPDIANMEGAAFFYSCLLHHLPALQVRSISDRIGPRDRAAWDIPGAVRVLGRWIEQFFRDC